MIDLYSAATPNGWKASIILEEVGLPYTLHAIDFALPHATVKERPAVQHGILMPPRPQPTPANDEAQVGRARSMLA